MELYVKYPANVRAAKNKISSGQIWLKGPQSGDSCNNIIQVRHLTLLLSFLPNSISLLKKKKE